MLSFGSDRFQTLKGENNMCTLVALAMVIAGLFKGDAALLITSGLFAIAGEISTGFYRINKR